MYFSPDISMRIEQVEQRTVQLTASITAVKSNG